MAYDGFYGDLSTRGTSNQILTQALNTQAKITNSELNVKILQEKTAVDASLAKTSSTAAQNSSNAAASAATTANLASGVALGASNSANTAKDQALLAVVQSTSAAQAAAASAIEASNNSGLTDIKDKVTPTKGATIVGYDGSTVGAMLDDLRVVSSYANLRSYSGRASTVQLTDGPRSGRFRNLGVVSGYTDNDATIIISTNGVVWQRINTEVTQLVWWNIDGLTDMSSQLLKAVAVGKPVELPDGTIYLNVSLPTGTVIRGRGKSKTLIRPVAGNTSNVIRITGANAVKLTGFKIQGGATAKEGESTGLIHCSAGFYNVYLEDLEVIQGSQCGIVFVGGAESNERSTVTNCSVYSNRYDGIQISETAHVDLINNQVHNNSHGGIALQPSVWPPTAYAVNDILIDGNRVYNNIGNGIYVLPLIMGGSSFSNFTYSFTNQQYCKDVRVCNNQVFSNSGTGIMAGGYSCTYTGNGCVGNGTSGDGYSGIVVAGFGLTVTGNTCTANSTYGIDVGGSAYSTISSNICTYNAVGKSFCIGFNLGASTYCSVTGNTIAYNGSNDSNTYQMMIAGWDGDGLYSYEMNGGFNVVSGNNIRGFANNYGIYIRRNVLYHQISNNYIGQVSRVNGIINETDFSQSTNIITNNSHDISTVAGGVTIASAASLVIDDYNSYFVVTGTTNITSLLTKSNSDGAGKIVATRMTAAGSGYTSKPTVTISGGGGTGATATAELGRSGGILGISMTNGGSGYTSNPTITISGGGGTGATATAVFGMRNHTGRRVTLQFEGVLTVTLPGMNSSYTSAGGSTLTVEGRKNGNGQWLEISRST